MNFTRILCRKIERNLTFDLRINLKVEEGPGYLPSRIWQEREVEGYSSQIDSLFSSEGRYHLHLHRR